MSHKIQKIQILYWIILGISSSSTFAQNYTSYFTGNTIDTIIATTGGICLMGGATEDDSAMFWFLKKANGGDVLVLRTTGSNGYNNYMYTFPGVGLNSVETIVCNNSNVGYDTYVQNKIMQAEAIWFAGGDQWEYISYWRNTPVDSLIRLAVSARAIPIGGTSAGMAIMGQYYFTAENGTVTSATALNDPYDALVTIDSTHFIENSMLTQTITDTHFDNPDRKGRAITFMARAMQDQGVKLRAIACDEYTAVCIEPDGTAKVFGGFPTYDDNAYFMQANCELVSMQPETCMTNSALTWDLGGQAVKVYKVKGTTSGANTFNLIDWQTGNGGAWEDWSVTNGLLTENPGNPINCSALSIDTYNLNGIQVFPNPVEDIFRVNSQENISEVEIRDAMGRIVLQEKHFNTTTSEFNLKELNSGVYFVSIHTIRSVYSIKLIKY